MLLLLPYLIKLSISVALVFLFYRLLLYRLTFYNNNRLYLLGYSLLSFIVPLINITSLVKNEHAYQYSIIHYIPAIEKYTNVRGSVPFVNTHSLFQLSDLILMVFLTGTLALAARLVIRLFSILKMRKRAVMVIDSVPAVYQVNENINPFSFGNAVYINQKLHSQQELEEIILHEYVHVKQKHTLDILFAEILCMVNWYNPFSWLIRHSIRQNLEFIADREVLKNGIEIKKYQYHLLKMVGNPSYHITNGFHFSSLKNRIAMMYTLKSTKLQLTNFLFILPLLLVTLAAFRGQYKGLFPRKPGFCNDAGIVLDAVTNKPLAGVTIKETHSGLIAVTDAQGFYILTIPLTKDSLVENFHFERVGYESNSAGFAVAQARMGCIHIFGMFNDSIASENKVRMFMGANDLFEGIPSHADIIKAYDKTVSSNVSVQDFLKFIQSHPEVYNFYTSENHVQQIVFLKNGPIEKYGYANGPDLKEMEKKYGPLPEMIKSKSNIVSEEYLEKWRNYSFMAKQKFKTNNPSVRSIIFPGDSRVIVTLKAGGKPIVYDMDSEKPEERRAFENLYGKLPTGLNASVNPVRDENKIRYAQPTISDTTPRKADSLATIFSGSFNLFYSLKIDEARKIKNAPLVIVDGKELPPHTKLESVIIPDSIESIEVLKDSSAKEYYGIKGINGVIVITSKMGKLIKTAPTVPISLNYSLKTGDPLKIKHPPVVILDGKELPEHTKLDAVIAPDLIESISVFKDSAAIKYYGEKGRDGVIIITSKKASVK